MIRIFRFSSTLDHFDFQAAHVNDPMSTIEARKLEKQTIHKWLREP